ncbi:hypothetical protein [Rhodococcus jostii]|uniref:Dihydrofolate reductase n=1 Tax=Rhodococcus jostii TaxID=132919 RepID=A0A1H5EA35_RHOJO|nr:hypothetical protein SAMN04490220_5887 [Rhodococcus jostii]
MRTLAITQNITLDGSIEMLGDWFDPADQDPQLLAATRLQSECADAILLGRQTFEDFRGYWPPQTDDQIAAGHLSARHVAIEDFTLAGDEEPFDLVFAIRVGALDGRHPQAGRAAIAHIAAATTHALDSSSTGALLT